MANLDTRSKRASSVGILLPFLFAPVLPDGTIDQGDRQHIAYSYSGIAATSQFVPDIILAATVTLRVADERNLTVRVSDEATRTIRTTTEASI